MVKLEKDLENIFRNIVSEGLNEAGLKVIIFNGACYINIREKWKPCGGLVGQIEDLFTSHPFNNPPLKNCTLQFEIYNRRYESTFLEMAKRIEEELPPTKVRISTKY